MEDKTNIIHLMSKVADYQHNRLIYPDDPIMSNSINLKNILSTMPTKLVNGDQIWAYFDIQPMTGEFGLAIIRNGYLIDRIRAGDV